MTTKPPLESRLLHLHLSDGRQSGYVILLNPQNEQAGGIFDLKDPADKSKLQIVYEDAYRTQLEKLQFFVAQREAEEKDRFERANKTGSANYSGGVFHDDVYYESVGKLLDHIASSGQQKPQYVYGSKKFRLERIWTRDIWQQLGEDVMEFPDPVPGSDDILNAALQDFYETNSDKLTIDVIDYSLAILLQ